MATECEVPKMLRLSNYFEFFYDGLAVPIGKEEADAIWRRLETKANHLQKGCSWKELQALLEAEATSKVALRQLLKKLFAVSQELSEMAEIPVEEVAVFLLHLFIQEPVTSLLLKQIMKHVFRTFSSTTIIHRVHQIVGDIATVLPPYTIEVLQEKHNRLGYRQEMFGSHVDFVPLDQNKIVFPDVSPLCDIILMNENIQNEDLLIGEVEDNTVNNIHEFEEQKFSDITSSVYRVHCLHFETAFCEEVKLYTSLKTREGLDLITPVSELDEAGQSSFEVEGNFNSIESALFESVVSSDKNLMVSLPLGFDKTNMILLAVHNLLATHTNSLRIHKHQLKVLYLVASKEAAEHMSQKLADSLESLKIVVRCSTTTTDLSKTDFESVQILVTTVNVWRDISLTLGNDQILEVLRLLVIDEMNWLQEFCGPALETIVTRAIKRVKSQRPVRILGFTMTVLSANCSPAFYDMAKFLHVDSSDAFVIGQRYATVLPHVFLQKVKVKEADKYRKTVDDICCTNVDMAVCHNKKVVIFVNSDADAVHTAEMIRDAAHNHLKHRLMIPNNIKNTLLKFMADSTSEECRSLCLNGYLIINSEMTASARNFISSVFRRGIAKFVVATSNYAWMLSNQGDTVIIKETEESGSFVSIRMSALVEMLNVAAFSHQKYTKTCPRKAIILSSNRFEEYLALFQNQHLVESQLLECLPECLNTEIIFGNVSNVMECEEWFRCTYLYHRMRSRAMELGTDLNVDGEVQVLVSKALNVLEKAGMICFFCLGSFRPTELGYIAEHLNIDHTSMGFVGNCVKKVLTVNSILDILSKAPVFSNIEVKEAEADELVHLKNKYCKLMSLNESSGGSCKVNILLQTHLSGGKTQTSGLKHDKDFVVKKVTNLARAMFEVSMSKRNAAMANRSLQVAKMVEKGVWNTCSGTSDSPKVQLEAHLQPVSRTAILVIVFVTPAFSWKEELYGMSPMRFWLWVEDSENNFIFNHQFFRLTKKVVELKTCVELSLPVTGVSLPDQLTVCTVSDKWLGAIQKCSVTLQQVSLPNDDLNITGLLKLQLLPVSVLNQKVLEQMYSFHRFSSVITQAFHSLYHRDCNVLLAASADKQRVIAAELAIFRVMSNKPGSKVVYLTSQKSEVQKRLTGWQNRFKNVGWKLMPLSEDISEDIQTFFSADILVTTAYRWEVLSRAREIQKSLESGKVSLIIVDELQVMDTAMEIVVSRMRAPDIHNNVRLIGLSRTALAYVNDIACFLGIPPDSSHGIYNFGYVSSSSSSTQIQIVAFAQKQYTTRMMVMSQAVGDTLQKHLQPTKCACVLVPTQRQVILTAEVLKEMGMNSSNPKVWLQCEMKKNIEHVACVQDSTVQDMLEHGIGILHPGMSEADCDVVQDLASSQKIRVTIISWDVIGKVEMKSHLLIVKGTERYSVSTENYIDMPVPEIADKIYSCSSCCTEAVIFTQESKKALYQAYFQDAVCVESRLLAVLPEYLNTEIITKTVKSRTSALDHLSHTYLGRRLVSNPSYYLGSIFKHESKDYQSLLVEKSLCSLEAAGCVVLEDSGQLKPTLLGSLSSVRELYHNTVKYLSTSLNPGMTQEEMLLLICHAYEFTQLPARVHDYELTRKLEKHSRWKLDHRNLPPVVVKVFFLLQSHFAGIESRLTHFIGYASDMKEVLVSAKKIVQAVIVICSDRGWLKSALQAQILLQMLVVGSWSDGRAPFLTLPHVTQYNVKFLLSQGQKTLRCLPELQALYCNKYNALVTALRDHFQVQEITEIHKALCSLPIVNVQVRVHTDTRYWNLKEMYEKIRIGQKMVQLTPRREYTLSVKLKEVWGRGSWTIILGLEQELQAMKTMNTDAHEVFLTFEAPSATGEVTYTLYLMSNSHIGLDQQFDLRFNISPV